jgi:bis(5'-nucleosyl)-tetraphosphatase (symmetrical)
VTPRVLPPAPGGAITPLAVSGRTIVIGDVHGCLAELEALLGKVAPRAGDALWFTGDLVNRGPDSAGVVALVRSLGARLVQGNHDRHHVRWRRHLEARARDRRHPMPPEPSKAFRRVHDSLEDADVALLAEAPLVARLGGPVVLVHAGLRPGRPLSDPDRPRTIRYLSRRTHRKLSMEEYLAAPGEGYHWSARWTGPWRVIYGHHAQPALADRGLSIGLDTGCVYGGRLTALILEALELDAPARFVQVKAWRAWSSHPDFEGR